MIRGLLHDWRVLRECGAPLRTRILILVLCCLVVSFVGVVSWWLELWENKHERTTVRYSEDE